MAPAIQPTTSRGAWSSGIFSCCEDVDLCCLAWSAAPCVYGDNASRVSMGEGCGNCCSYCCLSCCHMQCCVARQVRARIRNLYAIPEPACCNDCCAHFWCGPCALAQEARELKARSHVEGVSPYVSAAPQQLLCMAPPMQQMVPIVVTSTPPASFTVPRQPQMPTAPTIAH